MRRIFILFQLAALVQSVPCWAFGSRPHFSSDATSSDDNSIPSDGALPTHSPYPTYSPQPHWYRPEFVPSDSDHPIAQTALRMLETLNRSCEIDKFNGNLGVASYSQAHRMAKYQQTAQGLHVYFPTDQMDCSSLTSAVVASSGLLLKARQQPHDEYQPNTLGMLEWGTQNGDCFEPAVTRDEAPYLMPGDLIVNSGSDRHVVVVVSVENPRDPLRFEAHHVAESPGYCEDSKSKLELLWNFHSRIAQIVSDQQHPDHTHPELDTDFMVLPDVFAQRACEAYVARKTGVSGGAITLDMSDSDGVRWVVLRHKRTAECMNPERVLFTDSGGNVMSCGN